MKSAILVLFIGAVIFVSGCTAPAAKDYSSFTQCLTDSGIQEFGAYWCPNCARVKLTLGDAWRNLNYVECDPKCVEPLPDFCKGFESQTQLCLQTGIGKYPSWVKDGTILYTGTDMAKVSDVSGCPLPE